MIDEEIAEEGVTVESVGAPEPLDDPSFGTEVALVLPPAPIEEALVPASQVPIAGPDLGPAIAEMADRLDRKLDALRTAFDREVRAESTREKVVDRLHAELQEYKQDFLLSTLRPVFVDLIQLHDDIGKVAVADDAEPVPEVARLLALMEGFRQGIEDVLYRQGVEPFEAEGDAFDPRRQRAVSTVATDDPALNKTVAARLRKGFRSGDKVIRPEIVSVHALKK